MLSFAGWLVKMTSKKLQDFFQLSTCPRLGMLRLGDTLWLFNIAMENGPFIVDLPIITGGFPWLC
jgi:hypothetical protein